MVAISLLFVTRLVVWWLSRWGLDGVTLQSSINYLKAGKLDDVLTIKGECVHQGRTTCVVDVDITNQEGRKRLQGNLYHVCHRPAVRRQTGKDIEKQKRGSHLFFLFLFMI